MRTDLYLQDPVITRAMRTGYGYAFMEPQELYCEECGELIDDYDLDALTDSDYCVCGRCMRKNYEESEE